MKEPSSFPTSDVRERLETGLAAMALEVPEDARAPMVAFLALLYKWNQRFNLTAVRNPHEMVARHLLDSLAAGPHLHGRRILDVGTGAGLPGIPLALAFPRRRFVLLDSNAKKTRFVAHAVAALRLGNAAVEKNRAEDYRDEAGFDTVMCRAFGSLSKIIRTSGHLCAPAGCILAMKGRYPEQELGEVDHGWSVRAVEKLVVPGLEGDRHIVELRRI